MYTSWERRHKTVIMQMTLYRISKRIKGKDLLEQARDYSKFAEYKVIVNFSYFLTHQD